jgi:hypothetical protein
MLITIPTVELNRIIRIIARWFRYVFMDGQLDYGNTLTQACIKQTIIF